MLTAAKARERLSYDPETGLFRWKRRNLTVDNRRGDIIFNTKFAGKPAGHYCQTSGYVLIGMRANRRQRFFRAHRLAWLMSKGHWPKGGLDHINRIRCDNRLANLREATGSQNSANTRRHGHNTSGEKNVSRDSTNNKWRVVIRKDGYSHQYGRYHTIEEAKKVRDKAIVEVFGEFSHDGSGPNL